jgi:hypothetical protein
MTTIHLGADSPTKVMITPQGHKYTLASLLEQLIKGCRY